MLAPTPIQSVRPLEAYCAPGATHRVDEVPVGGEVVLQVVDFTPGGGSRRPVVVFVAGWISHIDGWYEVLREMTADFRVLYVETRDKSSARVSRKADYSVAALARDLAAVTAHYQLAPGPHPERRGTDSGRHERGRPGRGADGGRCAQR